MSKIINAAMVYAKQPSTWKGIAVLLSATGFALNPEQLGAISAFIISAIGLYEVFRNEKRP